ncbi:LPXTG cell wall anchor domain-containing protein [Enterococcus sp. RIT-PI-f]|uniref:LPXTG cell wall anchor domain-containing protein n=1 Tax=Enterococcus sp. RIT-PI-f TaxID=1690244 RepID=UPI0006B8C8A2|nr:LPXTG cell wall anchor domain-containing protein [Enterococcus sp. RIT-PI-f]
MKHLKSVCCILILFCMWLIASPQMTNARVTTSNYAASRPIIVRGRLGEKVIEEDPIEEDDKVTIVVDISQSENGRLPQTGSYLNPYPQYIGFFIIGMVFILYARKKHVCESQAICEQASKEK